MIPQHNCITQNYLFDFNDTVSEIFIMILSYSLNNDLPCDKLCKDLSRVVNKLITKGVSLANHQLVIYIKEVSDSDESLLPRIELKNS